MGLQHTFLLGTWLRSALTFFFQFDGADITSYLMPINHIMQFQFLTGIGSVTQVARFVAL
jgi:hypothetical protein